MPHWIAASFRHRRRPFTRTRIFFLFIYPSILRTDYNVKGIEIDCKLNLGCFRIWIHQFEITHGKENHLSILNRESGQKRLRIMKEAWNSVLLSGLALPKSKSQKDMWIRLMRIHIRKTCTMHDLEVFPKGPWGYLKEVVDNGLFLYGGDKY